MFFDMGIKYQNLHKTTILLLLRKVTSLNREDYVLDT